MIGPVKSYQSIYVAACGRDFPDRHTGMAHEKECPACEALSGDCDEPEPCCEHCGKPLGDFSDIGCGRCDRRSPDWGVL